MVIPLAQPYPRKLNLGSGFDIREGFVNVDSLDHGGTNLLADVTDLAELETGYFEEIVAQDILEHIPRARIQATLQEWSRLLVPEGTIFLRVPSLVDLLTLFTQPEALDPRRADELIHLVYGTQAYPGDFHLAGFTAATLDDKLARAGLQVCNARIRDHWLFEVFARKTERLSDPREVVHNAYFRTLHRPVDPDGLDHWVAQIASGSVAPEALAEKLRRQPALGQPASVAPIDQRAFPRTIRNLVAFLRHRPLR